MRMLEFSLVAVVLLAVLVFGACNRADRARDVASAGPSLGMDFLEDLPADQSAAIRAVPSVARRMRNFFPRVLANPEAMLFDWVWQDDRLKDRNRASQTVIALRLPGADLPRFLLAEKGAITREDARAAGGEIVFTTPGRWFDRHALHGESPERVRPLFPEAARASIELPSGLRLEGAGDWVLVYEPGRELAPTSFASELARARGLVETWTSVRERAAE
ncbi:MAG: hypothetical protein ACPGVZ_05485 [Myxococcota bacterium]